METYGKILIIAMPLFLLLVLFEKWYGWRKGNDTVRTMDMISSLSSGVTNSTKDVLGLSLAIISYSWLVENLTIYQVQSSWLLYVIAFLALDFAGYWVHRLAHTVNFFWNNHIVHHSSEEFNLACALRQSISVYFRIYAFLLIPAALFGVPQQVIAVVAPLHLFAQFWYHTQHIHKMGWLEYIIVTPAHHRVHHAINPEYLDKNYGQIFIFWDRMFGTFQEESPSIPAVYGVTRPVRTWNPIKINFIHLWLLIQDTWRTSSWKNKVSVWTNPTGWRPADVEKEYPVTKIDDVFNFEKYYIKRSSFFIYWVWIQIAVIFLVTAYLLKNIAVIGTPDIFIYGGFILIYIFALTDFMDGNKSSIIWEIVKACYGISILLFFGDWFGLDHFFAHSSKIIMAYFAISILVTMRLGKENQAEILLPNQRR